MEKSLGPRTELTKSSIWCHLYEAHPRFSRQVGITPIFEPEQMRQLLDSIQITRKIEVPKKHGWDYKEVADIKGQRDRAAIAVMGYTFARVSAVAASTIGDYQHEGKCGRLRPMEKGNKEHLVWLHREAEEFLDAYLAVAIEDAKCPCSSRSTRRLTLPARSSAGATCIGARNSLT